LDTRLERTVAIKVLPPSLIADEKARLRFLREARTASSLNHPGLCTIHEVGEADGQIYIVMELIEGEPLQKKIAGGLPAETILDYGKQLAGALSHAHINGVVHRD